MSSIGDTLRKLCDPSEGLTLGELEWDSVAGEIACQIPAQLSFIELIKSLGSYLTSSEGNVRRRATTILAFSLEVLVNNGTVESIVSKSDSFIALLQFFLERFGDYPSIIPCLRAVKALLRIVETKTSLYPTAAQVVSKIIFQEIQVQAMEQSVRQSVYELFEYILSTEKHVLSLLGKLPSSSSGTHQINGDPYALEFAANFVHAMDGEKDPRCLLVCLRCVALILNSDGPASMGTSCISLTEEFFDLTACYFPIAFTPPPNDPHGITREHLCDALVRVFSATPRLAPFTIPFLLEKLSSSILDSKRDSLAALSTCFHAYRSEALVPFLMDIVSGLRREIIYPRGLPEPGISQNNGNLPSTWFDVPNPASFASASEVKSYIGVLARSLGRDFKTTTSSLVAASDSSALQIGDMSLSNLHLLRYDVSDCGYSLLTRSSAPLTNALVQLENQPVSKPKLSPTEGALMALTHLSSVLESSALSAFPLPLPPIQAILTECPLYFRDFWSVFVSASITDVERAPESVVGRNSARALCAVAAASVRTQTLVLSQTLPVLQEITVDAVKHTRVGVLGGAVSLLAGLISTTAVGVSISSTNHPLSIHIEGILDIITSGLDVVTQIIENDTAVYTSEEMDVDNVESQNEGKDSDHDHANCGHSHGSSMKVDKSSITSTVSGAARLPSTNSSVKAKTVAARSVTAETSAILVAAVCSLFSLPPSAVLTNTKDVDSLLHKLFHLLVVASSQNSDSKHSSLKSRSSGSAVWGTVIQAVVRALSIIGSTRLHGETSILRVIAPLVVSPTFIADEKSPLHKASVRFLVRELSIACPAFAMEVIPPILRASGQALVDNRGGHSELYIDMLCLGTHALLTHAALISPATNASTASTSPTSPEFLDSFTDLVEYFVFCTCRLVTQVDPSLTNALALITAAEAVARSIMISSSPSSPKRHLLYTWAISVLSSLGSSVGTPDLNLHESAMQSFGSDAVSVDWGSISLSSPMKRVVALLILPLLSKISSFVPRPFDNSQIMALTESVVRIAYSDSLFSFETGSNDSSPSLDNQVLLDDIICKALPYNSARNRLEAELGTAEPCAVLTLSKKFMDASIEVSSSSTNAATLFLSSRALSSICAVPGILANALDRVSAENVVSLTGKIVSSFVSGSSDQRQENEKKLNLKWMDLNDSIISLVIGANLARGCSLAFFPVASALVQYLATIVIENSNLVQALSSDPAKQKEKSRKLEIIRVGGLSLAHLLQPAVQGYPFSRLSGAKILPLYKQKTFNILLGITDSLASNSASIPSAILASVCAVSVRLPPTVLASSALKVVPVILRALRLLSNFFSEGTSSSASLDQRDSDITLSADNQLSILTAIYFVLTNAPDSATTHLSSFVSSLIIVAKNASSPLVRAAAVDCIKALCVFGSAALMPYRSIILNGLLPLLDDPVRAVRSRVAACRNVFYIM